MLLHAEQEKLKFTTSKESVRLVKQWQAGFARLSHLRFAMVVTSSLGTSSCCTQAAAQQHEHLLKIWVKNISSHYVGRAPQLTALSTPLW